MVTVTKTGICSECKNRNYSELKSFRDLTRPRIGRMVEQYEYDRLNEAEVKRELERLNEMTITMYAKVQSACEHGGTA